VWRRFNEDKFWRKHNCILIHGGGQPPRGVRRMLHRLHYELKLPVYCLLDNDPWGYYIYSVIKQGSINLAYESRRMAIPDARFLGLRSNDYVRCELSPSVQIKLNEQDINARGRSRNTLVRKEETVAEGNRVDAEERFQTRSRSLDQQRRQLRYRAVRPRPP
jgi:DNA topoisomerase VI subunit A